jgi:hypothetical protein
MNRNEVAFYQRQAPFAAAGLFFAAFQRSLAAFLATAERCSGVSFAMRAFAPRRPSCTAAAFFFFSILSINAKR